MATFQTTFYSNALQMNNNLLVYLPTENCNKPPKGYKVVYLLHGLTDNYTTWGYRTKAINYAGKHNVALVMPEVQRSFYINLKYGVDYFSFITEELPKFISEVFPVDTSRESSFIAGLSMGGYGAMKCGLTYPDKYKGVACFSGAVDLEDFIKTTNWVKPFETSSWFGSQDGVVDDDSNLFKLAEKYAKLPNKNQTDICFCEGLEDYLYSENQKLKKTFDKLNISYSYYEKHGDHTWEFWDDALERAMNHFFADTPFIGN